MKTYFIPIRDEYIFMAKRKRVVIVNNCNVPGLLKTIRVSLLLIRACSEVNVVLKSLKEFCKDFQMHIKQKNPRHGAMS